MRKPPVTMTTRIATTLGVLTLLCVPAACGGEEVALAPRSQKLEQAVPKTETAAQWSVVSEDSEVTFEMQAPFERQYGEVPSSAISGTLHLDPTDLRQSTGLVAVDISQLEIFMHKANEEGEFGEREKSETQNEHMRDWLEIGDDVPAPQLDDNRTVEFSLREVVEASPANVSAMTGPQRVVTLTAKGEFLLHQRKSEQTVKLQATFHYDGDRPTSVDVETLEPFAVALPAHDVRPRTGFGSLANKTLGALSDKVGEEARVRVSFSATPAAP